MKIERHPGEIHSLPKHEGNEWTTIKIENSDHESLVIGSSIEKIHYDTLLPMMKKENDFNCKFEFKEGLSCDEIGATKKEHSGHESFVIGSHLENKFGQLPIMKKKNDFNCKFESKDAIQGQVMPSGYIAATKNENGTHESFAIGAPLENQKETSSDDLTTTKKENDDHESAIIGLSIEKKEF